MNLYNYAIFIGRFQPFHVGHLYNVQRSLSISQKVIIIIGSVLRAPSIKNPFSFNMRKQMIIDDLSYAKIDLTRIIIESVCDWLYDKKKWKDTVHSKVYQYARIEDIVAIVGHKKDASSYYLNYFPDWQYISIGNYKELCSTHFRKSYFTKGKILIGYMISHKSDQGTFKALVKFKKVKVFQTLRKEYRIALAYSNYWQSKILQPIFVTLNSMVVINYKILLIQRKYPPAQGLWGFPGGYLEQQECIIDGIFHKLFKNTKLNVSRKYLEKNHYETCVFDGFDRSSISRMVTHLGLFIINGIDLPIVTAGDNAKVAKWFDISTICKRMSAQLTDGHYQIIRYVLNKY